MRKADDQFVNNPVFPDRSRQWLDFDVVRPVANEMLAIETLDFGPSGTSRHRRDMGEVWFRRHGIHRGSNISVNEFRLHVSIEHCSQTFTHLLLGAHWSSRKLACLPRSAVQWTTV